MRDADMRRLVRAMVGHDIQASDDVLAATLGLMEANQGTAKLAREIDARADPALELEHVCYRDPQGVMRLDDVSLTVHAREIVGIAGVEGNGQSELGAILAGLASATSGRIKVNGTDVTSASPAEITACGAGIVPEDRHGVACIT